MRATLNSAASLALVAGLAASPAFAVSNGIFGKSGRDKDATNAPITCKQCHTGDLTPAPAIVVDGLQPLYAPGDTALLVLRVQQQAGSDGLFAGFDMASTSGAFLESDVEQTRTNGPLNDEITHGPNRQNDPAPEAYVDGEAAWNIELDALVEGRHKLFVAVNDANGNGNNAGDRINTAVLPFLVCDPSGADTDGDGVVDGCDACPLVPETTDGTLVAAADQADADGDGIGDACDNCPAVDNHDQADRNQNGVGDVCDPDFDECAAGVDNCSSHATCDGAGIGFTCTCNAGFIGNGSFCLDVDECHDNTDDCGENSFCLNNAGGFTCQCAFGFVGDGHTCVPEDAGVVDAGEPDSGVVDAGAVDAGELDAGVVDAGNADVDAGGDEPDAGNAPVDAGSGRHHDPPPSCGGCGAVPVESAMALVVLGLLRARRRRT